MNSNYARTLEETGKKMKLSKEYVRRLVDSGVEKLRVAQRELECFN